MSDVEDDTVGRSCSEEAAANAVDLAALLLDGPLAANDVGNEMQAAEREQTRGEHSRAAERYLEVARRLPDEAAPMRAVLMRRAADAYERAGRLDRALALLLDLAEQLLQSDDPGGASGTLREASRIAPPESRAAVEGMFAREDWPDDPQQAAVALRGAMDAEVEGAARWRWAGVLSGVLAVAEEWRQVDELAASLELSEGGVEREAIAVALDWLDAGQRLDRTEGGLGQRLLDWAGGQPPDREAWVRQRLAVLALRGGDVSRSVSEFRAAVALWSRAGKHDEQVVEAFDAIGTARGLAGDPEFQPAYVRLGERRGRAPTPARRAKRLEERALRALAREQFIEARRDLILATSHQRRAGNLRGEMRARELLARLLEAGERADEALWWAVSCGDVRRSRRLARDLAWPPVEEALRPGGARWERAASWAAIAAVGTTAPEETVETLAKRLLADAADLSDAADAYGLAVMSRDALAAVILQLRPPRRATALELLRQEVVEGQWAARAAAEALMLMTELGVSDEARVLLDAVLGENENLVRGASALLIRLVADRPDLRARTVAAAQSGDEEAVSIAAYAGLDDDVLRGLYVQRVQRLLEIDGPSRTSEQLISYEASGVFARYCDPPLQDRAVDHLTGVVADATRLDANRASAARALGNAADLLSRARAEDLLQSVRPLVAPPEPGSGADQFRRVRISFGPPEMLAVAVTELAGSLAERTPRSRGLAQAILHDAILTGLPRMWAAAARALLRAPSLENRIPAEAWLGHSDAGVREWGLALIAHRNPMFAASPDVARLADDQARRVRRALVAVASERAHDAQARRLLTRLTGDADAEVRAFARVALGEPAVSDL